MKFLVFWGILEGYSLNKVTSKLSMYILLCTSTHYALRIEAKKEY